MKKFLGIQGRKSKNQQTPGKETLKSKIENVTERKEITAGKKEEPH